MPESLSSSTQDYLKCVWTLGEWQDGPVSVTALAERLGLRTSSVSDGVRKLADAGLLEHQTYGGVTLTARGRAHAIAMGLGDLEVGLQGQGRPPRVSPTSPHRSSLTPVRRSPASAS